MRLNPCTLFSDRDKWSDIIQIKSSLCLKFRHLYQSFINVMISGVSKVPSIKYLSE